MPRPKPPSFSTRLLELKKKQKLTWKQIGDILGITRTAAQNLAHVEPKGLKQTEKLARALGVSPGWLAGWEE